MWVLRGLAVLVAAVAVATIGFMLFAWRSEIDPIERVDVAKLDRALIAKGEQLAAVGNCIACHTLPGGRTFAGGLPLPTPFGTIHSTNITPDPETGIGRWSEAAFIRSMREGVDREGQHLYPAFPYDHFTKVSDEDNRALYAYLMSRRAVRQEATPNTLAFPLQFRPILAGWKLLNFTPGTYQNDGSKSEAWNRGAYLAEGLGHCGACHTPRNRLGAEEADKRFAGGEAEGWQAYAINAASPAPIPWDKPALAFYLRHGYHEAHGVSRGPMAEVTGNLAALPAKDIEAIADYTASLMGTPTAEKKARATELGRYVAGAPGAVAQAGDSQARPVAAAAPGGTSAAAAVDRGAQIYAAACSSCHDGGRPQPYGGLSFWLSSAVNAPNPQNIINVTLFGLPPADGQASAVMPAYAGVLGDADMAALLAHLRRTYSTEPAWQGVEDLVRRTRSGEHKVSIRPTDGIERAPTNIGAED